MAISSLVGVGIAEGQHKMLLNSSRRSVRAHALEARVSAIRVSASIRPPRKREYLFVGSRPSVCDLWVITGTGTGTGTMALSA
ncbi:hypothetical protein PCANC_12385 [Puccinia coronata f. sp. avenae]|uniref:Uncharacterized protein n=1 Tax=Puccinia coronata f. sp. avenae TaxID=200324 RepID=A0A2N5UTT0_9BASI|nr:hypothetical protein PCANC_12385 [Puccinia coronata f. sp. avenae]PLW50352.1 hypothetical protein PCASD_01692 [Puccinia coronata f. sp. avenae]